jgi:hypothetical protein
LIQGTENPVAKIKGTQIAAGGKKEDIMSVLYIPFSKKERVIFLNFYRSECLCAI